MDLTLVSVVVLAALVFILSGMVGYLYWQQTRLAQTVQSIALAFQTHLTPSHAQDEHVNDEHVQDEHVQDEHVQDAGVQTIHEVQEDDRVSVEESVEHVNAPPTVTHEPDIDDYASMTTKQLQETLVKKGIPFGKRDSKGTLIEILKALST